MLLLFPSSLSSLAYTSAAAQCSERASERTNREGKEKNETKRKRKKERKKELQRKTRPACIQGGGGGGLVWFGLVLVYFLFFCLLPLALIAIPLLPCEAGDVQTAAAAAADMRRFRERLFGPSGSSAGGAGGEEANASSSEAKHGRYQRSPELEKAHNTCRHLEQVQLPQVRVAIRALRDQAKAAELAASAAATLADTVAFIDNNPYEPEVEPEAEPEVEPEPDAEAAADAVNGDRNDTANGGDAESEESEFGCCGWRASRGTNAYSTSFLFSFSFFFRPVTVTEPADDTEGENGAADAPPTTGSEEAGPGDAVDNGEQEAKEEDVGGDQGDESVLGEDTKDGAEKAATSTFLEAVEDLVEAYTIEVPR